VRNDLPRAAALIAAALLVIVLLATVSPVANRVRSIADLGAATGRGRITQWDRTIEMIAERPLVGWGPETYAIVFPRFIDAEFEQTVGRTVVPDRAHNAVLDMAAAAGLLGVAAYLAVLGSAAWALARRSERDPMTVALAGACVAYLVQLQFSFSVVDLDTLFWLFAGLMVAGAAGTQRAPRSWAVLPVVAALVAVVWGAGDVTADRALRRSLRAEAAGQFDEAQASIVRATELAPGRAIYLQASGRLHRRVGELTQRPDDFAAGLEAIERAQRIVRGDVELAMDRGDLFLSWGEVARDSSLLNAAATQYQAVIGTDPASSRAHLKLGVAYVQLAKLDDAERAWLTAAELSPRSVGPLINLGALYEQQGRDAEALPVYRRALRLDPDNARARSAVARLA
jgi:tetratricopeptide (TPR) repeat protein